MSEKTHAEQHRARAQFLATVAIDMQAFGRLAFPQMYRVPSANFHAEMQEDLQDDELSRVCFLAPRGHAKSSKVAKEYPLWVVLCEDLYYGRPRSPKYIVICSRTQGLAQDHLSEIKSVLESNQRLKMAFGNWGRSTAKQWSQKRIELKDGTIITCKGSGQQVVGMNYKSRRPTHFIIDDPEDQTNTKTIEAMNATHRWLKAEVELAVDPQVGRVIVIGTMKHARCLVNRLARPNSGWAYRIYSAIVDEGTPSERALWPEWISLEQLKKQRRQAIIDGTIDEWTQEMQNKIVRTDGDFSNLHYWEGDVLTGRDNKMYLRITHLGGPTSMGHLEDMDRLDEPKVVPIHTFTGVDPAVSASERADDSVVLTTGYDADRNTYSIEMVAAKGVPVSKQAETIMRHGRTYHPKMVTIETTAFQVALQQRLMEMMHDERVYLPGVSRKNAPRRRKKGDTGRLAELQPDVELGRVFVRSSHTQLRDEFLNYPFGEDNCLDAFWYARQRRWEPSHHATDYEASFNPEGRRSVKEEWVDTFSGYGSKAANWKTL